MHWPMVTSSTVVRSPNSWHSRTTDLWVYPRMRTVYWASRRIHAQRRRLQPATIRHLSNGNAAAPQRTSMPFMVVCQHLVSQKLHPIITPRRTHHPQDCPTTPSQVTIADHRRQMMSTQPSYSFFCSFRTPFSPFHSSMSSGSSLNGDYRLLCTLLMAFMSGHRLRYPQ